MSRIKKKQVFLYVIIGSVLLHFVILGVFAIIRIVEEVTTTPPEFEAVTEEPAPPPPPPVRPTRQSMPRPDPIAAQNPLDMAVPRIEVAQADMVMGAPGRGGIGLSGDMQGTMRQLANVFGSFDFAENTLRGVFYDLKQTREGEQNEIGRNQRAGPRYVEAVRRFTDRRFNPRYLESFFRAEAPLHASQFYFPHMNATEAPKAFGLDIPGRYWLIHYSGEIMPPRTGRYRFYGGADNLLTVSINRRAVLDGSMRRNTADTIRWNDSRAERWPLGSLVDLWQGDWVNMREGEWYRIDILVGETPGGAFYSFLLIEEDGVDYERDGEGRPILPVFRTRDFQEVPSTRRAEFNPPYRKDGPVFRSRHIEE